MPDAVRIVSGTTGLIGPSVRGHVAMKFPSGQEPAMCQSARTLLIVWERAFKAKTVATSAAQVRATLPSTTSCTALSPI